MSRYTFFMPAIIRVLVADDSVGIRKAISNLLAKASYLKLCGEAQDYHELLQKMDECKPDVVLMDLRMPGENEIDGAMVKAHFEGSCLIAMSFTKDEDSIRLAESCGAFRLLDKVELGTTLIPTIRDCIEQTRKPAHA
jgi:DNA-binding NarL/FixJ family response regulator